MSTEVKDKRKRSPRRNYQRELERVTLYLATVIRIKEQDAPADDKFLHGQIKAYKDIADYMETR